MKKIFSSFGIISGVSFNIWWWLFPIFLPLNQLLIDYSILIKNDYWIPINIFQVIGIISFLLFSIEFYKNFYDEKILGKIFFVLTIIGSFIFCGVAFYETFLWPIIAQSNSEILNIKNGPIYNNMLFIFPTGIGILAFLIGNVYAGIMSIKKINKLSGIIFIIGISFYCLGFLSGSIRYTIQSIGIVFLGLGLTMTSICILRKK